MNALRRWVSVACITAFPVLACGMAYGQEEQTGRAQAGQNQQREGQSDVTRQSSGQARGDNQLAAWLAFGNRGEVELGKFAQEKAQNEKVKQFAQKMVQDHSKFLGDLRPFLSSDVLQNVSAAEREGSSSASSQTTKPSSTDAIQPTTQATRTEGSNEQGNTTRTSRYVEGQLGRAGGVDVVRLKQEICEKCLASTKQELGQKNGAEFDKAYMGLMVHKHQEMIDTMQVMANHASASEFKQVLQQGTESAQHHLEMAKNLKKELMQSSQNQPQGQNQ